AGHPVRAGAVLAEAGELGPRRSAVLRPEQGRVLHTRVDGVGVVLRRLEVPDALELPGVRRAVIPLVRPGDAFVGERVADGVPREAAVARALHDLAEPAARLRGVDAVGIGGRSLDVIDLPPREVGALDLEALPLPVRRENERSLPRSDQDPDSAHGGLLGAKSACYA